MATKTTNFKENVKRWAAYMPQEAQNIQKITPQYVFHCLTEQGLPNLKTERHGKTFFLHNNSDPMDEANRWVKTLDLTKAEVVFVYGIGLGYYYDALAAWLHGASNRYIAFIEDDLEVIYRFMESDRAKTLLQDKQVRLFYLGDSKKGIGRIDTIAASFIGLRFKISALQLYLRQKSPTLMRFHTMLSFLMKMYEVTDHEYRSFSVAFFLNYYLNLFSLPESYVGVNLWGKWKNIPAIICGAGPSLSKNIDTLRSLQDRALIIGGSTSMNALNAGGVAPHFGVGIDPNPAQLVRIVSNSSYQTPYFCNFRLNSFALNAIHGDHLYISSGESYPVASWVDSQIGIEGKGVLEGYNVVNFALSLATALGCNPIIVVGVDLAYTEEKSYAPLPPIHPLYYGEETYTTKGAHEDLIARKDIGGKSVFTLWKWLLESIWYSKFAIEFPELEVINATEGGIGFPGVQNMPLKEVAEKYLTKEYDFEGLLHASIQEQCRMPSVVCEQKIAEVLSKLKSSLEKCAGSCKKIAEDYRKMIASIAEGEKYPYHLVTPEISRTALELDQEEAYQEILTLYNHHLMHVMLKEIQKLELDKEWLEVDEVSQEAAELHAVRFNLLKEAAQKNIYLIANALNAYRAKHLNEARHPKVSQKEYSVAPLEPFSEDCYALQNGQLIIKDVFLGIAISEKFSGTPISDCAQCEQYQCDGKFHGPSICRSQEGRILSSCWYYRGKRIGRAEKYYDDGKLYSVNRYVDGKLHGPQEYYYRDGIVRSRLHYHQGQFDGQLLLFFPNGQLKREIHYKEGKKEGRETLWNYDGTKIGEFVFQENLPVGEGWVWNSLGTLLKQVTFDKEEVKRWNEKGESIHYSEEQGKDYFDLVVIRLERFTKSLSEMTENIEMMAPLLEKEGGELAKKLFKEMHNKTKAIKEEILKLLGLTAKLRGESGLNKKDSQNEALWKTPTTHDLLHPLIEQMVQQLREQIVVIQNAFMDVVQSIVSKYPNTPSK